MAGKDCHETWKYIGVFLSTLLPNEVLPNDADTLLKGKTLS